MTKACLLTFVHIQSRFPVLRQIVPACGEPEWGSSDSQQSVRVRMLHSSKNIKLSEWANLDFTTIWLYSWKQKERL